MAVSAVIGRVIGRVGAGPLLIAGALLLGLGMLLLTRLEHGGSYATDALPGFLVTALGMGLCFTTAMLAGTAGIAEGQQGLASGLINTSQQVGQALGLAVLATVAGPWPTPRAPRRRRRRSRAGPPRSSPRSRSRRSRCWPPSCSSTARPSARGARRLRGPAGRPAVAATSGQTSGCWAGVAVGAPRESPAG